MLRHSLNEAGIAGTDQQLPTAIHMQHGINRLGKRLDYYFNYSSAPVNVAHQHTSGINLLDNKPVANGQQLMLAPWDLAIIEENATGPNAR